MAPRTLPSLHIAHHRRCESHRSQTPTPADLQPEGDEAHRAALARQQAAKAQKALERAAEERQPEASMPESLPPRLTKPEPVEQTSSGSDIEISVEEDDYEDAAQQIETTKHSHEEVHGSAAASHAKEHTDNNDPAEEGPSKEFNPLLVEDNEGRLSEQVDGSSKLGQKEPLAVCSLHEKVDTAIFVVNDHRGSSLYLTPVHMEIVATDRSDLLFVDFRSIYAVERGTGKHHGVDNLHAGDLIIVTRQGRLPNATEDRFI
uniref:Uncharacterized protein n=1 Tax=Caenorhabditis japonica TaxID=281687 RepID=A0A8R1IKM6_CAEJA